MTSQPQSPLAGDSTTEPAKSKSITEYERGYNTGYVTARRGVGAGVDDTEQLRRIADRLIHRAEAIYKLIETTEAAQARFGAEKGKA